MRFTKNGDVLYVIQTECTGSDLWIPELTLKDGAKVELLGCNHPVRWEHPNQTSLSTRRRTLNDASQVWSENPADGVHIRVGEIPTVHLYGEATLAFKITGANI